MTSPPLSKGRVREGIECNNGALILNIYPHPNPLPARERE